jgi:hypothetical protein
MRKIITIVAFLTISLTAFSQEAENALEQLILPDSNKTVVKQPVSPIRKLKTGMDVETAYMFTSSGYGGPMFSLTPHVIYPLSDRFWLEAGIKAGYGQYMMPTGNAQGQGFKMLPMTQLFMYASGNYKVSERLTVNGIAYRQVLDNPNSDRQAIISNYINNGISVGVNYKLGSSVTIGAQVHINSGNTIYPYSTAGNNPYGGYSNPYGW